MGAGIATILTTIIALATGVAALVRIILIIYLTIITLKDLIRARLEQKEKSKVAFGSTRKIVNKYAREILVQAPSMTMAELEKVVDDSPYFIVDYDPEIDEESDFTTIQTEAVEEKVKALFYENNGIVLFD